MAGIGEQIYFIRRLFNRRLRSVSIYDCNTQLISTGPDSIECRENAAVCVLNGKIYLFGGYNGCGRLASCEVFDIVTQKWSALRKLPFAISQGHAIAISDNFILLCGGSRSFRANLDIKYGKGIELDTIYRYDIAGDRWTLLSICLPCKVGQDRLWYDFRNKLLKCWENSVQWECSLSNSDLTWICCSKSLVQT